MTFRSGFCLCVVSAALSFPVAAGAQTAAAENAVSADSPRPLSITQRYVPPRGADKPPRAPLTLLIDDSPGVAGAPNAPAQPAIVEEVGDRPAIAALAPGRLAITVSAAPPVAPAARPDNRNVILFQNGRPLPPLKSASHPRRDQ